MNALWLVTLCACIPTLALGQETPVAVEGLVASFTDERRMIPSSRDTLTIIGIREIDLPYEAFMRIRVAEVVVTEQTGIRGEEAMITYLPLYHAGPFSVGAQNVEVETSYGLGESLENGVDGLRFAWRW